MKHNIAAINEKIERFFNGETTNSEEAELVLYFSKDKIADEHARYKPIFIALNQNMENYLRLSGKANPAVEPLFFRRKRTYAALIGVGALLAGVFFYVINSTMYDPFEGSVVMQNGIIQTDRTETRKHLNETLMIVLEIDEEVENILKNITIVEESLSPIIHN